jgi:HEAT repeat protein
MILSWVRSGEMSVPSLIRGMRRDLGRLALVTRGQLEEFEAYLTFLVEGIEKLESSGMSVLSGLDLEKLLLLQQKWNVIPTDRRQTLIRNLIESADENPDLEYESVFLVSLTDILAEIRKSSITGLWDCEDRTIIAPIIKLMRTDEDEGVRSVAAQLAGKFALQAELGKLLPVDQDLVINGLLESIYDPEETLEVRRRVLEALGSIATSEVYEIIRDFYDDDDERLKGSALYAMGVSGDENWLDFIIDEMSNSSSLLRYEAAHAASALGSEEVMNDLANLVEDVDPEVQRMAVTAVGTIGGSHAVEILQELRNHPNSSVKQLAIDSLELIDAFNDPMKSMDGSSLFDGVNGSVEDQSSS